MSKDIVGADAPIVVMGVSGAGKTLIGGLLAEQVGGDFVDADDLHSSEARAKMNAGTPLTDEDRAPWLMRVGERIAARVSEGGRPVVACSALRRRYRDSIRAAAGSEVVFVCLDGSPELLAERIGARTGHFMPPALLQSQLATLEPLEADELGVAVSIVGTPDEIVAKVLSTS